MNIPNRTHRLRFLLLQAAAIGLLAGPSVHADTIDWGGGTSAAWATGGNWAGGTAPADDLTTDIANFNVATYGGNPVYAPNAGTRSINGITIGGTNGAMTLTTTSLGIGGSGISIASGAGAFSISGGLTLGAAQSWINDSAATLTSSATVNNGGFLLTVGGTGATTISGNISGAGGLTSSQGNTTLTLSGTNNTYGGVTTISDGRLGVNNGGSLSPNTAVTVSGDGTSGGQLFFQTATANQTFNNAMTLSGVGFLETDGTQIGAIRFENGVTLGGTLTLPADARVGIIGTRSGIISGQVTGSGGLEFYGVKSGNNQTSTFTLSNTGNDYAGTTTISSKDYNGTRTGANNTLRLEAAGVIPDGVGKGIVAFTGTSASHTNILDLNGFAETVNGLSTTGAAVARITNTAAGTAVLTVGAADTTSSFSGVITEAGSGAILALTKTGTGTLTLSGANTYTGTTTINAGTIEIGNAAALGSSGTITFGGGGLKYGTGITQDLSSRIKNCGSSILVDTNGESVTWGTALDSTNSGGLAKNGAGTLILSSISTYTGNTTVNAGTLKLNVAGAVGGSSGVSIASGASLDLSAITGGLTLASGQSLGGAGSILGNLLFGSGSKLVFSTTDTLAMSTGTASFFAGTAGSRFGIDDLVGISSSTPTGTYTLISGTVDTTNLDNLGSGNAYNLGAGVSAYFQQGSLQVVVVPEPGAVALVGIGVAGVAWAVTRRRPRRAA